MNVVLRGISGPGTGLKQNIEDGCVLSIGRTGQAKLAIPQDSFLSGAHFSVENAGGAVVLRDLGSRNGTSLNDAPVGEGKLADGDLIAAGQSVFRVSIEGSPLAPGPLEALLKQEGYLFAVLDAARDPKIHGLVMNSGLPYCSLYRGRPEVELEMVAPYLIYLPPNAESVRQLIQAGWSQSWGIFLTCLLSMDDLRRQLRRSLMVNIEGMENQVYFRFYDPRVLRVFLSIAEPHQLAEFGGPISGFYMEDEVPDTLLRFYPNGQAIGLERIPVTWLG